MDKIIILDDMPYVRYRIKDTMESIGLQVCETGSSFDFFKKLSDNKDDICLIILEVGLSREDGFEILRKIKAKELNIPIMILTKLNTRSAFIKCIKEGTSEYILKPFNPKMLLERTRKLVGKYKKNNECGEIIYLNFQEYISKQIKKCESENKNLSVMASSLIKLGVEKSDEKIEVKDNYLILMDILYEKLKTIFKLPDLFEKYGISAFISVLPDCDENGTARKIDEIINYYENMKSKDSRYVEYKIVNSYVTFPEDGLDKGKLLDKLAFKMKCKING